MRRPSKNRAGIFVVLVVCFTESDVTRLRIFSADQLFGGSPDLMNLLILCCRFVLSGSQSSGFTA